MKVHEVSVMTAAPRLKGSLLLEEECVFNLALLLSFYCDSSVVEERESGGLSIRITTFSKGVIERDKYKASRFRNAQYFYCT